MLQEAKRSHLKRVFLSVALLVLTFVAVYTTDYFAQSQRPEYISDQSRIKDLNRAIASAQPMEMISDIDWEHRLAKRLGENDDRQPASVSQAAGLLDQLRYGELEGNYRFSLMGSNAIKEIEFVENMEMPTKPIFLREDPTVFLTKYREIFSVKFQRVQAMNDMAQPNARSAASSESSHKIYQLFDGEQVVGQAVFAFDTNGRLISIKIQ